MSLLRPGAALGCRESDSNARTEWYFAYLFCLNKTAACKIKANSQL